MGRATGYGETAGGLRGAPLGLGGGARSRRIGPPRIAATAQSLDTAGSLQRTPQSVLLLEAEDAAEPPLQRSGQGSRTASRRSACSSRSRRARRARSAKNVTFSTTQRVRWA